MSIRFRLTVMNFMQFFVWGAWLISFGAYMSKSARVHRACRSAASTGPWASPRCSCLASWASSPTAG